jgi:hypothetical protein
MNNDIVPCKIPERLTVTLTDDDIRALLQISEYLYTTETADFAASSPEERKNHILVALHQLDMLLQEMLYDGPLGTKPVRRP